MPLTKEPLDGLNDKCTESHFFIPNYNGSASLHYVSEPFLEKHVEEGTVQEEIRSFGYDGLVNAQQYKIYDHVFFGEKMIIEGTPVVHSINEAKRIRQEKREPAGNGTSILFNGSIEDLNEMNDYNHYDIAKGKYASRARKIFEKNYHMPDLYNGKIEEDIKKAGFDGFVKKRLIFREDNPVIKAMNKFGPPLPVFNIIGIPIIKAAVQE
ncbi:MAG: hypothetical protein GOV02_01785 [Candidatus Aenigmarchaeota archaeon]|nr:hypothetical protein [Candidatus Aenigmarchaeota archaeon]